MNKKKNRGFSLVELIVVVAIMAVLVGVLAPSLLRYVEKTRIQKDVSAVSEVREAVIVAMADEAIFTENKTGATVTIGDNTKITCTTGSPAATSTKLEKELETVIGSTGVDFTSKALGGNTVTLTVTVTNSTVKCAYSSVTNALTDDYATSSLTNIK